MTDDEPKVGAGEADEALSLSTLRKIDAVCDRFRTAWLCGESPRLEDFVDADLPPGQLQALFASLLDVELRLRCTAGEAPDVDEYRQRFSSYLAQVDEVFASAAKTRNENTAEQSADASSGANRRIGPYKLLQKIGEGGMGTVWMAEQQQPIQRRVALKLIKSGQANKQILARFESERQALAMMDHQHVARILDAGAVDDGTPYFVMELVQGEPITAYCDRHKLSVVDRLRLFIPVCEAVQHAHQKGIIHRDLKPSNILVHWHDGQAKAKVIDFGLAKALQHQTRLTDKTVFTEFGQVVGTIQYMSPEQARLDAVDVDTRTDIYSLGVILYELLAGSTPIEQAVLEKLALLKVLEMIRETEPPRPSHRLSSSIDKLDSISQHRRVTPTRLQQVLRGDLDWIVMKALDKDRTRRYPTPLEFAEDLRDYLSGNAIRARPPSHGYRLWKFVRKHRVLVAASLAIIGSLAGGIVAISIYAMRAETSRVAEEKARKRSEDVLQIVVDSFKSVDPNSGSQADMPARDVLLNAQERLGASDLDEPGQTALLDTLGACFIGLGDYESAAAVLERAVKLREVWLGVDHPHTMRSRNNLAIAYDNIGRFEECLPLFEQVLQFHKDRLGDDHPDTLTSMNNLASVYGEVGQPDRALSLQEQALRLQTAKFGDEHPQTQLFISNLAVAYNKAGRLQEAIPLHEKALKLQRASLGEDHPSTLASMYSLAADYHLADRLQEAIALYEQTLKLQVTKLGDDHPSTLLTLNNLAVAYRNADQLDEALPLFERELELMRQRYGDDHPQLLGAMASLAAVYQEANRLDDAIPLHEQALTLQKSSLGAEHYNTLLSMNNLALAYSWAGRHEDAARVMQDCLAIRESLSSSSWETAQTRSQYGEILLELGKTEEAETQLVKGLEGLRQSLDRVPPVNRSVFLSAALERLVQLAERRGDVEAQTKWQQELAAVNNGAL